METDPFSERNVDFNRFAGDTLALFGFLDRVQRTHVMQAVGQLDQQDADILGHRENQLAEIFGLLALDRLAFNS